MAIAAIIGYLLGSIPTAVLVGKLIGVDPRIRGDGNPGWWNMRGLVGNRTAALVLFGDVFKGALAAWIGSQLWGPWWIPHVAVFGAMVGHAFPIFGDFRGGRSVLTFVGGMLVLTPLPAVLALGAGLIAMTRFRHAVHGARLGVLLIPVTQAFWEPPAFVLTSITLMGFIALRFLVARPLRSDRVAA